MTVDRAARVFVLQHGLLWERLLYNHLFEGGSLAALHDALRAHRNPDGGYGLALEPDIRCAASHPLALEFLLNVLVTFDLPPGDLLDGAAAWAERVQQPDGTLSNPPDVLADPHAPWWASGGQHAPDSIVGNLARFGAATPGLLARTRPWVAQHHTAEQVRATEWLFMAYHAHDFYFGVPLTQGVAEGRDATVTTILALAEAAPPNQAYSFFRFANTPHSPVGQAAPPALVARLLGQLAAQQHDDGGWRDQHELPQWSAYTTIQVLAALRAWGHLPA